MTRFPIVWLLALIVACGRPADPPADGVASVQGTAGFDRLYGTNCAGCHGANGQNGAALSLNDSVYRTIMDSTAVRRAVATGVPGTLMPAFARSAGGELADSEIAAIVAGIRRRWGSPMAALPSAPAHAAAPGNPQAGADAYAARRRRAVRPWRTNAGSSPRTPARRGPASSPSTSPKPSVNRKDNQTPWSMISTG